MLVVNNQTKMQDKQAKIYVAGHRGLAGSAIVRKLQLEEYNNLVTKTSEELDLRNQQATEEFFATEKPEYVFLAAAKVGGILANSNYPADFLYDNVLIAANVIHASYKYGVTKLLNLGSSCIYPKYAPQPLKEESLLTDSLEPTNRAYAIAKIAAIELCDSYRKQHNCNFISAMPTNLYGPNDNYDLETSHVLAALLRKFHEAKQNNASEVVVWGTGKPKREFLHADDLADACIFLMQNFNAAGPLNVGTGKDISITDLAKLIKKVTGFQGAIVHDLSKPDGTPRKVLDVNCLYNMGWQPSIDLHRGIRTTYQQMQELSIL